MMLFSGNRELLALTSTNNPGSPMYEKPKISKTFAATSLEKS